MANKCLNDDELFKDRFHSKSFLQQYSIKRIFEKLLKQGKGNHNQHIQIKLNYLLFTIFFRV